MRTEAWISVRGEALLKQQLGSVQREPGLKVREGRLTRRPSRSCSKFRCRTSWKKVKTVKEQISEAGEVKSIQNVPGTFWTSVPFGHLYAKP